MTAAQQIAELQQRIQALEFSLHEKEKELDAAAFLGGDSALRLHAAIAERDNLKLDLDYIRRAVAAFHLERDALRAEVTRLRNAALATNAPDWLKDDKIAELQREVACYKAEAEHLQGIETERDALRARLAAAERVCVDARDFWTAFADIVLDEALNVPVTDWRPEFDTLTESLAAYDAAKEQGK